MGKANHAEEFATCFLVSSLVLVAGFNEEDEDDGKHHRAREDTENDIEWDVAISEGAKPPIGKTAATDADEIHDAITSARSSGRTICERIGILLQSKHPQPRPNKIRK